MWKCLFDGAYSKEGIGAGFLLITPGGNMIPFYFKLEFEATNNVAEYETLIFGLELAKTLKVENLVLFGDFELIVKQIINFCQTKHPRFRAYRNEVWDYVDNYFQAFIITSIPREENIHANALEIYVSSFKIPNSLQLHYQIKVKYRPSI